MPRVGKKCVGKGWPCPECGHEFRTAHDLLRHSPQHDPRLKEKLKIPCPYAGCKFSALQQSNLDDHINIHTGEKPHKCREPGCVFCCANRSSLTRHYQDFHQRNPRRRKPIKEPRRRALSNDTSRKTPSIVPKTSSGPTIPKNRRVEVAQKSSDDGRRPPSGMIAQYTPRYAPYVVPGPNGWTYWVTPMPHMTPYLPVYVDPAYNPQEQQSSNVVCDLHTRKESEAATHHAFDKKDSVPHVHSPPSCSYDRRTPDSSFSSPSVVAEDQFSPLSSSISLASSDDDDYDDEPEIEYGLEALDLASHPREEPDVPHSSASGILPLRYPPLSVKPHLRNLLNPL